MIRPPSWYYLYLRTPSVLELADKALEHLDELGAVEFGSKRIQEVEFSPANDAWKDGIVFRIPTILIDSLPAFVADLKKWLGSVEAWAIHDGQSASFEYPSIGKGFIEQFLQAHADSTVFQIYLRYDKDDQRHVRAVDGLKAALERHGACRSVFHFRDGVVWLAAIKQPPKIVANRCQRFVKDLPGFLCIEPTEGRTFSCHGDLDEAWVEAFDQNEEEDNGEAAA